MCHPDPSSAMAEIVDACSSSNSSIRLFRPWDAKSEQKSSASLYRSSRRSKLCHSRKDSIAVDSEEVARTQQSESQGNCEVGHVVSSDTLAGVERLPGRVAAAAAAADALYAELSRADLARLGLVCPADLARLKARKQRPKKYRCPNCHVAFSNNGQLRGHIRIHTGERPFVCPHAGCGKAFTRNEELTRHRRIHSGVRPYPCTACGKRFGRKDHLKKHTRTHQRVHGASAHAAAAAFSAAAAASFFPLDPAAFLPTILPTPYPGVFGF